MVNNLNLDYDLIHYILLQPFPSARTSNGYKHNKSENLNKNAPITIINVQPEFIFEHFYYTSIKKIYYFIAVSFRYINAINSTGRNLLRNNATHTHKEYLSGILLLYILCAQNKHTHLSRQTFNSFEKRT